MESYETLEFPYELLGEIETTVTVEYLPLGNNRYEVIFHKLEEDEAGTELSIDGYGVISGYMGLTRVPVYISLEAHFEELALAALRNGGHTGGHNP